MIGRLVSPHFYLPTIRTDATMDGSLYKVDIHIFNQDGHHIALNVRESRFFTITTLEHEILSLLTRDVSSLETLCYRLGRDHAVTEVHRALERLKRKGLLLTNQAAPFEADRPAAPAITCLELNVAQDCNLSCPYCIVENGEHAEPQRMSRQIARKTVDLLLQESRGSPVCRLAFVGGEPLLNFHTIRDAVTYGERQAARYGSRMVFSLSTNGTLLNDESIDFIREHQLWVMVSLDGPPAIHNQLRYTPSGIGSYEIVAAKLSKLLRNCSQQVSLRATITRHSPPVSTLVDYLASFGTRQVILLPVVGNDEAYALDVAGRERLKTEYTNLARCFIAGTPKGDFSEIALLIPYLRHLCSGRKRRIFCGAGTGMLGVCASGELYPCTVLARRKEYRVGDVATGIEWDKLSHWRSYLDVDSKPPCQECWARYICGGGCLASAAKSRGGPLRPVRAECELQRHLIQLAIWVHLELRQKQPEIFLSFLSSQSLDKLDFPDDETDRAEFSTDLRKKPL